MTGGQAPHEVLGVAKDANTLQIVSAYRRLAWHPDRNRENPQAKAYFQEIHLAYTALMKEKSPKRLRQQWNAATHAEKFTQKPHSGGFVEALPHLAVFFLIGGILGFLLPPPLNWIAFSAVLLLAYGNYRSGQTAIAAKIEGYFKLLVRLYFVAWLGFAVWRTSAAPVVLMCSVGLT